MSANFTGDWNAILSKSKLLNMAPKAMRVHIENSDSQLHATITITKADGAEQQTVFKCDINDRVTEGILDARPIRVHARWQAETLIIESWLSAGPREFHFCDHWSLSADRRSLSMEHRDDDIAGQLTVLERA